MVITTRRLCPYFQAHMIKVLTKSPLVKVLQRPDNSGRLVGWLVEFSEFDIEYLPKKGVKGQALADCDAEFSRFPPKVVTTMIRKPCGLSLWMALPVR